ncbi:MAG: NADH-quinone oxidoreductase subunit N, partial [Actinomyces sp.]
VIVVGAALLMADHLAREGIDGPEMYALMLVSAAGGVVMAGADDLVVLFLGLETLSIAVYVMVGLHLKRLESLEAGLKYFVMGAFSSAFLLYGIALVYGATGSTNLVTISAYLGSVVIADDAMLLAGFALLLVGFGFKVAAVPFHAWTPDVYQGAPSPVVAYMGGAVKIAAFAALVRTFVVTFTVYSDDWRPAVYALAVATLVVGAVLAVVQGDVKRMLAYSSIVHAGFVLVAVESAGDRGVAAALFYLATYAVLVLGSFGIITVVSGPGDRATRLADLDGLAARRPALALAFTVLLLAQAGVPLTSGFVAKFEVVTAAVDAHSYWLAGVAMVAAVVAAFVYLRILLSLYLGRPAADAPAIAVPGLAGAVIAVAVAVTLVVGMVPGPLHDLATDAVPRLILGA